MDCSMPVLHYLLELLIFMTIESVILSNHLFFCCHLLILHSIFHSIRVFPNESALHIRWPKYWSFSFSINPSPTYSGLISFRIDWCDFFAVEGILKSSLALQCESINFSVFSLLYGPISYPYMTTGKTMFFTIGTLEFLR